MTASRRTVLVLFVGLSIGPIPACVVTETPAPTGAKPADKQSQFAVLPARPGEKIPANPAQSANSTPPAQSVSRRPEPAEPTAEPPPPPDVALHPASGPGPLPPLPLPLPPTGAPESPLVAAVRATVENRPDEALRHLQALDKSSQDFALAVIPLLLRGSQLNPSTADPNDVAALVEQLRAVADRLEPRAALRIDKVTFCRRVSGFGRYEPRPEAQPYRPRDFAELYVEIRHVTSGPAAGPAGETYVTRLVSTLEIRDAGGKLVEQTDPDDYRRTVSVARFERADYSHTPPRDYFLKYKFPVPSVPGVYTVVVEVKDPTGQRTVRSKPARFDVAGP
jgi:hypothetical protein